MLRNPWPVISSFVYPMRRNAARTAFSLIGGSCAIPLGKHIGEPPALSDILGLSLARVQREFQPGVPMAQYAAPAPSFLLRECTIQLYQD